MRREPALYGRVRLDFDEFVLEFDLELDLELDLETFFFVFFRSCLFMASLNECTRRRRPGGPTFIWRISLDRRCPAENERARILRSIGAIKSGSDVLRDILFLTTGLWRRGTWTVDALRRRARCAQNSGSLPPRPRSWLETTCSLSTEFCPDLAVRSRS